MLQVTHLLDSSADEQARSIHSLLVRHLGDGFVSRTATLGPGGDCRGMAGATALLRRTNPHITIAWGQKALAAAVLAGRRRVFFSPARFAGPQSLRWIRPMIRRADATMICASQTQRRLAIARGIAPHRSLLIPPAVESDRLPPRQDERLRLSLGFTQDHFVIVTPGESTLLSGHAHAVWASAILSVLHPACKLLVWGRGPKAAALPRRPGQLTVDLVTLAEEKLGRAISFEELLGAADVCLVTPTGMAPTLPIATAMAAGVPIVAVMNSAIAELLEDGRTALTVPRGSPRALVQRLLDLRADPILRDRIVDNARTVARERFSVGGMISAWRGVLIRNQNEHRTSNTEHPTWK